MSDQYSQPYFRVGQDQRLHLGDARRAERLRIHSNIRWDLGPLKYVFCSLRYHHWHHSSDDEAIDKNYVAHLPAIDWIFGTFYMPRDSSACPRKYGTVGIPPPKGIIRKFFHPFHAQAGLMRPGTSQEKSK
jgi:hypothetical protein